MSAQGLPDEEYLIIGPSQAGKTSLVGVLDHASVMAKPARFEVNPENKEMEDLMEQAGEVARYGKLPWSPSQKVTTYQFSIRSRNETRSSGLGSKIVPPQPERTKIRKHMFQLLDGPGEVLFPDPDKGSDEGDTDVFNAARQELIDLGKRSKGLILALDASDPESVEKFFRCLAPVFRKMCNADHFLPFERMVLLLTKVDKVFYEHRRDAQKMTQQTDPWIKADELLGYAGIRNLTRFIPSEFRRGVYCGWASTYGFVPDEGTPNFKMDENDNETLLVFDPQDRFFIKKWEPFQVLDPFVYLATGETLTLKPLPPQWH